MSSDKFLKSSLERLKMGANEYGDKSFFKPDAELLKEVSEELFDVATWCSIWACRYSSSSNVNKSLTKIAIGAQSLHENLQASWKEKNEEKDYDDVPGVDAATAWLQKCLKR